MKKSMELYMNAAGWVIGLVGAGYAIGVHCKMNALAKKLDSKIDRLADDAAIQIPDYIIKDAVDKAVVNRTDYAIQRATNAAITDIHAETARQVKSAINKEYVTLQGSVKKEIKDQLGRIDISDLREEVKDEAKNQLAESEVTAMKPKQLWKIFTYNGKEIFAYTIFGEGADEEEATIALLAYENHCYPEAIHVHKEMR